MKRKSLLLRFVLFLLLMFLASCGMAEMTEEESGELEFSLTSDGQNYKVTGIGSHKGTTVTIPDTYKDKSVVYIATDAFKNNRDIKKVIIPATVTQISKGAFDGCSSLATFECHATKINLIGANAFRGTAYVKNKANYENGGLYLSNMLIAIDPRASGEFRIKEGTFTVAYQCFKDSKISSVVIPKGCANLGQYTFYEATRLKSVIFEDSIGYLGVGVFYGCSALQSINLPTGCVNIYERAFFGCTSLKTIVFGEKTKNIKEACFSGCTSLETITLPAACETIGNEAFLGCTSLRSIGGAAKLKSVGAKAFRDCTALTSCTLPQSATYGTLVFANTPLE